MRKLIAKIYFVTSFPTFIKAVVERTPTSIS